MSSVGGSSRLLVVCCCVSFISVLLYCVGFVILELQLEAYRERLETFEIKEKVVRKHELRRMQQRVSTLYSGENFLPKSRERGQFDLFLNFQSRLRPEQNWNEN